MPRTSTDSIDSLIKMTEMFPASRTFDLRCREAVRVGIAVRRLRETRTAPHQPGAVGFGSYMRDLARLAGMPPATTEEVFEWFGAASGTLLRNGRGAARLANGVGMDLRELIVRVRVEVAEASSGPLVALARGHQTRVMTGLEECEQALSHVQWDPECVEELRAFEREAEDEYVTRAR